MRKAHIIIFVCFICIFAAPITAQEMSTEQMQKMMELAKPGPEHEMLAKFEGEWDDIYTFRMGMQAEPMKAGGNSNMEMILGGRFMKWTAEGEIMGRKTESMIIMGFDRRNDLFTLYGFDTMGTYAIDAKGSYDDSTKTITFEGTNYEPVYDKTLKYRIKFDVSLENEYKYTVLFETPDGETYMPIVEIEGVRK